MRDQIRQYTGFLLLIALLAIIPIGAARHLLSQSRNDALVPDKPNYLSHQYPPSGDSEMTPRLSQLLGNNMKEVDAVPRTFLAKLPENLPDIQDAKYRKQIFISAMLPLVLRANELIVADRGRLIAIKSRIKNTGAAGKRQRNWLETMAKRYRVKISTPAKTAEIDRLLLKVDVIPPSLALAQAAMESGWGSSYFAQEGNALFGQWVWGDAQGILPRSRDEGKTHRIKKFEYLLDSVRSYMTNLNRHKSYKGLRDRRAELRKHSLMLTGSALAPALVDYSERGADYVGDILSIINYNDLDGLDNAQLTSNTQQSR
ncbi:glucosaminidase domain-containing protein [Kordiimonas aquimaris]|uniref:glucosaminidase domain-containing protein n=1 Tax=Kordiimonas aquimaris TaxID=707591 RepID=UPI0021D0D4C5|nr:glucosaminidase domain-containing protein [Kordiimonas aquimaris]